MAKKEEPEKSSAFKEGFKAFHSRYKSDTQFNAGIKLSFYAIFLISSLFLLSFIASLNTKSTSGVVTTTTTSEEEITTTTATINNYGSILNNYSSDNKSISIKVTGDNNYIIEESLEDNVINGSIETEEGIIKFVIRDHKIYESKMGNETENETLLDNYDINFIDFSKLIVILTNMSATKTIDNDTTKYIYDNISISDITYDKIVVTISDNKITNITATNPTRTIEIITK